MFTTVERMRLFYTTTGLVGKTAIEIQMETLRPIDSLIEMYEYNNELEEDLYTLAINKVQYSIYKEMETFYRKFYDKLFKEKLKDELKELIGFQDEVVKVLTNEVRRRKNHFYSYRREYMKKRKELKK